MTFFLHFINVAIVNSWIVHRRRSQLLGTESQFTLTEFQRWLADELVSEYRGRTRPVTIARSLSPSRDHAFVKSDDSTVSGKRPKLRCSVCQSKGLQHRTVWQCITCNGTPVCNKSLCREAHISAPIIRPKVLFVVIAPYARRSPPYPLRPCVLCHKPMH
jgi:hypothetical protein